jgi:hypothetical protein
MLHLVNSSYPDSSAIRPILGVRIARSSNPQILRSTATPSDPQTLRSSDPQTLRSSDPQTLRSSDPQILRSSDPQILRSSDPQILRSSDPQILRSSDPQIVWSSDPRVLRPSDRPHLTYPAISLGLTAPKEHRPNDPRTCCCTAQFPIGCRPPFADTAWDGVLEGRRSFFTLRVIATHHPLSSIR